VVVVRRTGATVDVSSANFIIVVVFPPEPTSAITIPGSMRKARLSFKALFLEFLEVDEGLE
jgi:hypothetical protein